MSSHVPTSDIPRLKNVRIAIVYTEWNEHITKNLAAGALESLMKAEIPVNDTKIFIVPGAVELTYAASRIIKSGQFDAVIVLGCVIKGDTPHFDYVCSSVTQGITSLNATGKVPVIFGVLTVLDEQQAFDRCGGALGNKGSEAAETALKMIEFSRSERLTQGV
ncbi:MAG: 6,7-dimethyl-8-ribityllumazine synthase [Muribaculaceae bacterium]|nr:6,7-dimethyl-8-ribityllumazine synthase [Muribaculaceae bacterium]